MQLPVPAHRRKRQSLLSTPPPPTPFQSRYTGGGHGGPHVTKWRKAIAQEWKSSKYRTSPILEHQQRTKQPHHPGFYMRQKQTSHLLSHIHFELLQEQLPSISTHTISNTFPFDFCVHSPTCAENKEGGPFLPHSPLPNYCRSVPGEVSPGFPSVKLKMLTTSAK